MSVLHERVSEKPSTSAGEDDCDDVVDVVRHLDGGTQKHDEACDEHDHRGESNGSSAGGQGLDAGSKAAEDFHDDYYSAEWGGRQYNYAPLLEG